MYCLIRRKSSRLKTRRRLLPLGLALTALLFAACSGTNPNNQNPVSDYHPEFNEPEDEKKTKGPLLPDVTAEQELFEKALDAYDRELYTLAKESFAKLQESYPTSYYTPFAQLKIGDCAFFTDDYTAALAAYQEFLKLYPRHEAAPYAKFHIAESHRLQYRGPKRDQGPLLAAIKSYQLVIKDHPHGQYAAPSRRNIVECREKLAEHEALVAEFYLKQGQREASANRFRELSESYAGSASAAAAQAVVREQFGDDPVLLSFIRSGQGLTPAAEKTKSLVPQTPEIPGNTIAAKKALLNELQHSPQHAEHQRAALEPAAVKLKTEVDTEPQAQPFLASLDCGLVGEYSVFSANLNRRPRIASQSQVDARIGEKTGSVVRAVVTQERAFASRTDDQNEFIPVRDSVECSVEGITVILQELALRQQGGTENTGQILIKAQLPKDKRLQLIALDKPYRVVGVIDEVSSRPSSSAIRRD
ncbi:MAG TPA: outer membrane protein assembly factor BamD [Oligoflexia bacterium]|nr:outer membrane protein assembly factor BamD [Oligoflexia bacterium]